MAHKTLWEMTDEEIEFAKRQSQANIKNALIAGLALLVIWGGTLVVAASSF